MQARVGRAERRPAQIQVVAQAGGGILGLGQQLAGPAAVLVLGGGYGAPQQERAVDRQRLGIVSGHVVVNLAARVLAVSVAAL